MADQSTGPKRRYDDMTHDELVRLLASRDRRDATRFGLVWEADEIERDKALNQDLIALEVDADLSCPKTSGSWKNLIIEGDNFDALRYLRMTFAGRVKCIYIDPPYNTGNKDFVYNDRFVDKEDLWRHSKWCEFMYQRLTLAKDLLTQDGVIFVSIDDNEICTLGLLMQRIFGEQNFVTNVVWHKRVSPANDAKHFSTDHDYLVVYALSKSNWRPIRQVLSEAQKKYYTNPDNDPRGEWNSAAYTCAKTADERPNLYYAILQPNTGEKVFPNRSRVWAYDRDTHREHVAANMIYWGKDGRSNTPRIKKFLTTAGPVVPRSFWTPDDTGHNSEANLEMRQIFGGYPFTNPKPVRLIERILRLSTTPDDSIILDFFAGSGTTAHAVHKLNKEDGGDRRVILVSSTEATVDQPDKNLCRDVCATRVRRVIEGYGDTPGLGGDFAYLRCRRIAPGRLLEIGHAEVWTALQLMHCSSIAAYEERPILVAGDAEQQLIYIPRYRAAHRTALRKAVEACQAAVIYSWQPELVREQLGDCPHVQIEAVTDSLARRFRIKA